MQGDDVTKEVEYVPGPPPKWRIGYGYTLNLTKYEFLRVDIALEESLLPSESKDDAFKRIDKEVTARFYERVNEEKAALEERLK